MSPRAATPARRAAPGRVPASARPRAGLHPVRRGARGPVPRRGAPAPAPRRRRRWLLLLALLALALYLLWPAPPPPPLPEPPPVVATPAPPVKRAPPRKKPAPAPAPPAPGASQRALLMAAVQQRAPQLRSCPLPPGAPGKVATRLRITQAGKTRSVAFSSSPSLPAPLAACLREHILQWDFAEVQLRSDVDLLASFALGG